jgi:two-component system sensor histidine kinase DegS
VSQHSAWQLEEIDRAVQESVQGLERRIGELYERLDRVVEEVERERARVQARIEELMIERTAHAEDELARLRAVEDRLTGDLTRASTLRRQLANFSQLLKLTRQQWGESGLLPGLDAAQRLAVRQAMIQAQEEERRRLAREIHDGPAQVLANAILNVQFAARVLAHSSDAVPESLQEELTRIEQVLREGLSETRRFIVDLQPTMLKQHGLLATLRHYVASYRRLFAGDIVLELPDALPSLSPEQELAVFRIVQEALHNVLRHARARRIGLKVFVGSAELVIMVEDDGQGFRHTAVAPTSTGGFGLQGMHERAEVIGAQLTIRSEPGRGTVVTLVVPLGAPAERAEALAEQPPQADRTERERVG